MRVMKQKTVGRWAFRLVWDGARCIDLPYTIEFADMWTDATLNGSPALDWEIEAEYADEREALREFERMK